MLFLPSSSGKGSSPKFCLSAQPAFLLARGQGVRDHLGSQWQSVHSGRETDAYHRLWVLRLLFAVPDWLCGSPGPALCRRAVKGGGTPSIMLGCSRWTLGLCRYLCTNFTVSSCSSYNHPDILKTHFEIILEYNICSKIKMSLLDKRLKFYF